MRVAHFFPRPVEHVLFSLGVWVLGMVCIGCGFRLLRFRVQGVAIRACKLGWRGLRVVPFLPGLLTMHF